MVKVVTHVFVKCALRDICKVCWEEAILISLYMSIMTIKGIHSIYHGNAMFFGHIFLNYHLNNMVNVYSNHYVVLYNELPQYYHLITVLFLYGIPQWLHSIQS